MFTEPHTDHEVKCKIGHKWLRYSHLASAPAVLIQVGHYTVAWYRHRQATAHIRQLDYVLAKNELSCSRPGLPDRYSLSITLLGETKMGLLVLSLLTLIHSPLFPPLQVGEKLFSRHHIVYDAYTLYASTVTQCTFSWDIRLIIKWKAKQPREGTLNPWNFIHFT